MEQESQYFTNQFTFEVSEEEIEEEEEGGEGGVGFDDGSLGGERQLKVRLDKWLWAARFFKTRALARAAVEAGKISYNGERSKPSREIEIGAELKIRQGRFDKKVIVKGLSTRRRSTEEAFQLFEEQETLPVMRPNDYGNGMSAPRRMQHPQYPMAFRPDRGGERNFQPDSRERRGVRFLRRTLIRNSTPTTPGTDREQSESPYVYRRHTDEPEFID